MGGNPTIVSNAIVLEVLNHDNYKDWSSRVETYLVAEDLWDAVRPKTTDPEIGESDEYTWKIKNAKALHAIKISCGSEIFSLIREISVAKMAWEKLERKFKSMERLRLERKCMLEKVDECAGNERSSDNCRFDPSYKPFFDHVVNGDWDKAKGCLANRHINGVLTAKLPENGCAALHLAARKGHVHVAKELVSLMVSREDLEARGKDGQTALHEAAHIGNWHIVKELVSSMRPEGLGIRNKDDASALHKAVSSGHVSIVEELASKMREEDLVTKDAKGFTALIGCVLASHAMTKDTLPKWLDSWLTTTEMY